MPLRAFAALVCLILGACHGAAYAADSQNIFFKTTPRVELLRPFADPIDLSLLITGADGKPVKEGSVEIRLDAPKPGRFFSTDFPLLEGTLLNEMRLPVRQGRARWNYLFPIRGEYRLAVDFLGDDGAKASKTFAFAVRENRQKLWALGGFSLALLILGIVAGRIFTRTGAAMILVCGAALSMAFPAGTHVPGESGPPAPGLEIEPAIVGKPTIVRWRITGDTPVTPGSNTFLTLAILHLEKQKVVFAVDKIPVADEWSMKFHFPDGAGYRVSAVAETAGRPPIQRERVIAVSGVEPPAKAMAPALAYFIGLIAAGLAAGRWSKRRGSVPGV